MANLQRQKARAEGCKRKALYTVIWWIPYLAAIALLGRLLLSQSARDNALQLSHAIEKGDFSKLSSSNGHGHGHNHDHSGGGMKSILRRAQAGLHGHAAHAHAAGEGHGHDHAAHDHAHAEQEPAPAVASPISSGSSGAQTGVTAGRSAADGFGPVLSNMQSGSEGVARLEKCIPPGICYPNHGNYEFDIEREKKCFDHMMATHSDPDCNTLAPDWRGSAPADQPLIVHTVWGGANGAGIGEILSMMLRSFVHTQDRKDTILWLWSFNPEGMKNKTLAGKDKIGSTTGQQYWDHVQCAPNIVIKHLDIDAELEEVAERLMARTGVALKAQDLGGTIIDTSDFLRSFLSWKYGGFYIDSDTLLKRDLRMLVPLGAFSYRWSWLDRFNTAVMGFSLLPFDPVAEELFIGMIQRGRGYHPAEWCLVIKDPGYKLGNGTVKMLSPTVFDPLWLSADDMEHPEVLKYHDSQNTRTFAHIFNQRANPPDCAACGPIATWFPHAFTHHWHGKFDWYIVPNTWSEKVLKEYPLLTC